MNGFVGTKRRLPGRLSLVVEGCDPRGNQEQIGTRFVFPFGNGSDSKDDDAIISIGRSRMNFIQLTELTVSKLHAQIKIVGETVMMSDLGSKHGSYLNEVALEPNREYTLRSGDAVCFGRLKLRSTFLEDEEY